MSLKSAIRRDIQKVIACCMLQKKIFVFAAILFSTAVWVAPTCPAVIGHTLENSIRTQIFTMPDETRLLSGHGPETTVGNEKKHNPFVGEDVL